jgi:hypothetical protein
MGKKPDHGENGCRYTGKSEDYPEHIRSCSIGNAKPSSERKQKCETAHKKNYQDQDYGGGNDHRVLLAIATFTADCGESTGGICSTVTVLFWSWSWYVHA